MTVSVGPLQREAYLNQDEAVLDPDLARALSSAASSPLSPLSPLSPPSSPSSLPIPPSFVPLANAMPPLSQQLLLLNSLPAAVDPRALLAELKLPSHILAAAERGLADSSSVMAAKAVLSPSQCRALREAVDADCQRKSDSVDGGPDHQLKLSRSQLASLVGSPAVEALWSLPSSFSPSLAAAVAADGQETRAFVRRYSPSTRPWNPFHVDSSAVTCNVALTSDEVFEGGALLALSGGEVREVRRGEGDVTVHSSSLLHGVSRTTSGARYSLILFVGDAACRPPALAFGTGGAPSREEEAAALRDLMGGGGGVAAHLEGTLSRRGMAELREIYERREEAAGMNIERVVARYAAPHLRPLKIKEAAEGGNAKGAGSSLRQLLLYME